MANRTKEEKSFQQDYLACSWVRHTHSMPLACTTMQFLRLCCMFFTYKEDISVLRTSSVCKSPFPAAQVRVSPLNPGYPRREGLHIGKLLFLAWSQRAVILWRDTCVLFCCQGHYIHLVMKRSSVVGFIVCWCSKRWAGDGGTSCQGPLECTDLTFSVSGANALGNWWLGCWTIVSLYFIETGEAVGF